MDEEKLLPAGNLFFVKEHFGNRFRIYIWTKNAEGPPDSTTGLKTMRKAGTSKTKNPVPRLASALLSLFTPFENRASILGDYEGMFDDLTKKGLNRLKLNFRPCLG
jgi:hypothetical protein